MAENLSDHAWPTDPDEHMWGDWQADQKRSGRVPATQYRMCIHPKCHAVERRAAPGG